MPISRVTPKAPCTLLATANCNKAGVNSATPSVTFMARLLSKAFISSANMSWCSLLLGSNTSESIRRSFISSNSTLLDVPKNSVCASSPIKASVSASPNLTTPLPKFIPSETDTGSTFIKYVVSNASCLFAKSVLSFLK